MTDRANREPARDPRRQSDGTWLWVIDRYAVT